MERVEEVVAVYIEQQPEEAVSMALEGGGRGLLVSAVVPADLFSFCFGGKLKQRHHTVENPGRDGLHRAKFAARLHQFFSPLSAGVATKM